MINTPLENVQVNNIICEVCQESNPHESIFCKRCVSPINVQKISDYTTEDKQLIFTLLLEALAEKKRQHIQENKIIINSPFWGEYLNMYWLRPETAIWRTIEAEIMSKRNCLQEPLLDLGCGDGINVSILKGNKFSKEFDTFQCVKLDDKDIYNYASQEYHPKLITQTEKIACGIDIKETLVQKTKQLQTYHQVLRGDIHHIPCENQQFQTVYSNVIKDFANVQPILKEVNRVLKQHGQLVLTTPNHNFKKNLYFINQAHKLLQAGETEKAQKYIEYDRGRSIYSATQKTNEEWTAELEQAGFKVKETVTYISPELTKLFDIGTRSFSVDLIQKYHHTLKENHGIVMKELSISFIKAAFEVYLDQIEDENGSFMLIIAEKIE